MSWSLDVYVSPIIPISFEKKITKKSSVAEPSCVTPKPHSIESGRANEITISKRNFYLLRHEEGRADRQIMDLDLISKFENTDFGYISCV